MTALGGHTKEGPRRNSLSRRGQSAFPEKGRLPAYSRAAANAGRTTKKAPPKRGPFRSLLRVRALREVRARAWVVRVGDAMDFGARALFARVGCVRCTGRVDDSPRVRFNRARGVGVVAYNLRRVRRADLPGRGAARDGHGLRVHRGADAGGVGVEAEGHASAVREVADGGRDRGGVVRD